MATFAAHKVVSALPTPLEANAIYAVRVGEGFDLYITDATGLIAFRGNPTLTWGYLKDTWSVIPTKVASIIGDEGGPPNVPGTLISYTLTGVTRYRFVPGQYDPTHDAFYSTWTGATLSGLIVARG